MSNTQTERMTNFPPDAKFVCIDGKNYAVPSNAKDVIECERGYLYFNPVSPVGKCSHNVASWSPTKILLHTKITPHSTAWPIRLVRKHNSENAVRVFTCSEKPCERVLKFIDCTKFNYNN